MLWNIVVNDAGADYDPLTLLRTRTMFGRPDFMSIYDRLRWAIEGGRYLPGSTAQLQTKVGVSNIVALHHITDHVSQTYFCGPGPVGKAVKAATEKNSGATVNFSFAKVRICDRLLCFPDCDRCRSTSNASSALNAFSNRKLFFKL